jgi:hypothetical protein
MVISKNPGNYHFSARLLKKMSSASGTWWQWGARNFDSVTVERKLKASIVNENNNTWCLNQEYALKDTFKLQNGESRMWKWGASSYTFDSVVRVKSDSALSDLLWLTLTNRKGCNYRDSLFINFKSTSADLISIMDKSACRYDSIRISYPFSLNKNSFIWSISDGQGTIDTIEGVSNFTITGKKPGNYQVRFVGLDTAGCNDELTDVITFNPTPALPNFDLYEGMGRTGDTMRLRASTAWTNYWWNNVKTTDSLYWFVANTEGIVEVSLKISNEFGCESETAYRKYPIVLNQTSGLQMSLLEIYPNPAKRILYVEKQNNTTDSKISLMSIDGKQMTQTILASGNSQAEINVSQYPKGIYWVRISSDSQISKSHKITIE